MVWFRENWYEEVLRQLRAGLAKCYTIAFDNRVSVSDATITPHTLNFVKKLVSTFGIGVENVSSSVGGNYSAGNDALQRRSQVTMVTRGLLGNVLSEFRHPETKDQCF